MKTFFAKMDCLHTSAVSWDSKILSSDGMIREYCFLHKAESYWSYFDSEREEESVSTRDHLFSVVNDDECEDNFVIVTPEGGGSPGIATCRSREGTLCGDDEKRRQEIDGFEEAVVFEEVQVVERDVTLKILKNDSFSGGTEKNWGVQGTEMPNQFKACVGLILECQRRRRLDFSGWEKALGH